MQKNLEKYGWFGFQQDSLMHYCNKWEVRVLEIFRRFQTFIYEQNKENKPFPVHKDNYTVLDYVCVSPGLQGTPRDILSGSPWFKHLPMKDCLLDHEVEYLSQNCKILKNSLC